MAADAARAAGRAADLRSGHVVAGCSGCCATAPRRAMPSTRRAWCRSPNTAATACASCAQSTGIAYDERSQGTLQLFRTQKQVDGTAGDIEVLKQFGVPFEVLDPAGCIAAEPALASGARARSSAACGCPATRPATARCSPSGLPRSALARGVTFRFGTTIDAHFGSTASRNRRGQTSDGMLTADAYVVALGSYSPRCCASRSASPCRSIRSRAIRSPCRSPTPPARRYRPSWTRPTRWRSPGSATASASAAPPRFPATI